MNSTGVKPVKKISLVIVLAMLASACAPSGPIPRLVNGHIYMTGGKDCESWHAAGAGKLACIDKDNNYVGSRTPMSWEEVKAWQKTASFQDDMAFQTLYGATLGFNSPAPDLSIFDSSSSDVAGMPNLPSSTPKKYIPNKRAGTPIYSPSECIGAVVNGRCTGNINPNPSNALRQKCYGTMINGECQGAIGY